jgi:hypothetical protein
MVDHTCEKTLFVPAQTFIPPNVRVVAIAGWRNAVGLMCGSGPNQPQLTARLAIRYERFVSVLTGWGGD